MKRLVKMMLLVFAAASAVSAQDTAPRWSVHFLGAEADDSPRRNARIEAVEVEAAWQLSEKTDAAVAVAPMKLTQPGNWFGEEFGGKEDVRAALASIVLRHHPGIGTPAVRPYLELGLGAMWADARVPAATSHFNVVTQPGVGITLNARGTIPITIGYRFLHISNGGYAPRNPGLNVDAIFVGVGFKTSS